MRLATPYYHHHDEPISVWQPYVASSANVTALPSF